ncbi:40S ribosomal protein S13 [Trifolium repens]|nr:40S ribosomal protein S13 [Trifolium repens]
MIPSCSCTYKVAIFISDTPASVCRSPTIIKFGVDIVFQPPLTRFLPRLAPEIPEDLYHLIKKVVSIRLAPEIPEDLYHLIKKVVSIRNHLERNIKDKDSKFRLILVDSRIHRLARYYKKTKKLPPVWKYESTTATNALVA